MTPRRVAITGMGVVGPMSPDVEGLSAALSEGRCGTQRMTDWDQYTGLTSQVGAAAELLDPKAIPRKDRRSMGRLSMFAVKAAEQAVADAGLGADEFQGGRLACIVGSTMGSAGSITEAYELMLPDHDISFLPSTKFFQCVSHTAAMNVAKFFGIKGSVMATSAACASGLQALGTGYEAIRFGRQDLALCGGAEELHPTVTGSFDVLFAASAGFNDSPSSTPRPFDRDRDGLVCGEGSGMLVLEDYERALARGATIHAEVIGYNTCGSGEHVSQSNNSAMVQCMRAALADAEIEPDAIDYVNAHATATAHGDAQEVAAIRDVFGSETPVSSLKGSVGHLLGASGPVELIASVRMMQEGRIYPTVNLEHVAEDCEGVRHVTATEPAPLRTVLKNSFAFGGINAALIVRAVG